MALGGQQSEWNADSVEKLTKLLCVLSKVEKTPGRLCSYSWSAVCCDPVGGRVAAETTLTRCGESRTLGGKTAGLTPLHNCNCCTTAWSAGFGCSLCESGVDSDAGCTDLMKNNPLTVAATLEALWFITPADRGSKTLRGKCIDGTGSDSLFG